MPVSGVVIGEASVAKRFTLFVHVSAKGAFGSFSYRPTFKPPIDNNKARNRQATEHGTVLLEGRLTRLQIRN